MRGHFDNESTGMSQSQPVNRLHWLNRLTLLATQSVQMKLKIFLLMISKRYTFCTSITINAVNYKMASI